MSIFLDFMKINTDFYEILAASKLKNLKIGEEKKESKFGLKVRKRKKERIEEIKMRLGRTIMKEKRRG